MGSQDDHKLLLGGPPITFTKCDPANNVRNSGEFGKKYFSKHKSSCEYHNEYKKIVEEIDFINTFINK